MHGELPKQIWAKTKGRTRRNLAVVLIVVAVAAALVYVFAKSPPQQNRSRFGAEGGPVPVLAAAAAKADVPVYLDAVGTIKALNTVTVRPQVDGKLLSVGFKEGDDVKKGDVLARIDPTIYKQQADTQRALVAQFAALVQSDQAAIENAQATLGYTTIVAPIAGRTGIRMVDEGNIVHASDANSAIVVIPQIKPISVLFSLPQQDLGQVNDAFAKTPLTIEAQRPDSDAVIDRGVLRVVDNQVDQTTGTVKLKAEFPNTGLQLWPGQFVNVRLLIDMLQDVVTIPTGAVQRGPNGTFVYVVKDDNTVAMRPIVVQKQDETQTVVKSGLTPPERVVTTGFVRLTDGSKVTIGNADGAPAAGQQGARPRSGQRSGGGRPNPQQ